MLYQGRDEFSIYLDLKTSRGGKVKNITYHCKSEGVTHWIELAMLDVTYLNENSDYVSVFYFYKNAGKGYRKQARRKGFLKVKHTKKGAYVIFNRKRYYIY